ncbi:lytic transglycosylase F [Vibrio sp. LQ2]|uniref:transglycosylase SLT domain-containing protein n=1 Tax=Vibrio sp. LQ2 TaxID=2883075 RepID=UPI00208F814B|nr:lytic transglycosylase F [Vibrio sp. LQ2]USP04827.1 lytic transglycosylase F [Vibrio sp. LQ2]
MRVCKLGLLSLLYCLSLPVSGLELSPLTNQPYVGDWPVLKEKGTIRVVVSADLGFYYVEGGRPKGIGAELLYHFEQSLKKQSPYVHVQVIPVLRDELIPSVEAGFADLAVANLTVTPSRLEHVDFSTPLTKEIEEFVVTDKTYPELINIAQLSGKEIWLRESSSYLESINKVNAALSERNLAPVRLHFIEEALQDYELLEMVNAGHISATVLDSHKAEMWQHVMENIQIHSEMPLREHGQIAWAMRKNSPKLQAMVNQYLKTVKSGTLLGNVIYSKYIDDTRWLTKALNPQKLAKLGQLRKMFTHYSEMYEFEYLMMAAQGFQESGFDQRKVSHKGAVGIMQVLPSTAKDPNVNIAHIEKAENNIHAGIKYMRFIKDRYFSEPEISPDDQVYFALAAYNAGPANINRMRRLAKKHGFNPNVWFKNVEVITRRNIGKETVRYVSNISRYYVVYKQLDALQRVKQENTTANSELSLNTESVQQ